VPLPMFGVVQVVRSEAVRLGVLKSGLTQPSWWPRRAFTLVIAASEPTGDALSSWESDFEKMREEWEAFGVERSEVRSGLLHDVNAGLAAIRPASTVPAGAPPGG